MTSDEFVGNVGHDSSFVIRNIRHSNHSSFNHKLSFRQRQSIYQYPQYVFARIMLPRGEILKTLVPFNTHFLSSSKLNFFDFEYFLGGFSRERLVVDLVFQAQGLSYCSSIDEQERKIEPASDAYTWAEF